MPIEQIQSFSRDLPFFCHFRSRTRPQRCDEVRIRSSHCRQVKEYPRPCPGCQRERQCEHQKEGEQQSQSDKEQQYGYDDIFKTGEVAYFVIHEHPVVSDSISSPIPNAKMHDGDAISPKHRLTNLFFKPSPLRSWHKSRPVSVAYRISRSEPHRSGRQKVHRLCGEYFS